MGDKEQTLEIGDIGDKGREKGTGERVNGEKTWFNTNNNEFRHMLS